MSNEEMRLECLKLAIQIKGVDKPFKEMAYACDAIHSYIATGKARSIEMPPENKFYHWMGNHGDLYTLPFVKNFVRADANGGALGTINVLDYIDYKYRVNTDMWIEYNGRVIVAVHEVKPKEDDSE